MGGESKNSGPTYTNCGVSITFPEGYVYEHDTSGDGYEYFTDDEKAIFLVEAGYNNDLAENVTEEMFVANFEQSVEETFGKDNWTVTTNKYNGYSCTEYTVKMEDEGTYYDVIASFVYFDDSYLMVFYMPVFGETEDYYSTMATIEYSN